MRVKHVQTDTDALIAEAATAVSIMRDSADLDARIGILNDRVGVANDRLAAFIVTMPDDYTKDEILLFKRYMVESLAQAAKETRAQIRFERTWNKLGE